MSSSFFAGLSGTHFPDVVMNQGPLPGLGGLPAPLHDTADGKINYNSSLLGDLSPYAYGEPGYLSSQSSYLNIPHRIQKIVPYLYLPEPDGTGSFQLCHPIDDGDIAFALRLDRNSEVCTGLNSKSVMRAGLGTAIDPMINLVTLNYLLAGMQLSTVLDATRDKWDRFFYYLDKRRFNPERRDRDHPYTYDDIKHVVRNLARPIGVAHGSEKQGGQHEGSYSPVTWPVNFVISLILDGKDANVVNIWYNHMIEAGNDLVLRLRPMPLPANGKYTLNHHPKSLSIKTFSHNLMDQVNAQLANAANAGVTHVWQLVPDIFSLDLDDTNVRNLGLNPSFFPSDDEVCWQQEGYWHIARTQIHSRKYGIEDAHYNDMANKLRTGHVDVTFQPAFNYVPHRDFTRQNGLAFLVEQPPLPPPANPRDRLPNVVNFLGEAAGEKRDWQQRLRLERGFNPFDVAPLKGTEGTGQARRSLESIAEGDEGESSHKRLRYTNAPVRVQHMMCSEPNGVGSSAPSVSSAAPEARVESCVEPNPVGASMGMTEDIGVFEFGDSMMQPTQTKADECIVPSFQVPKPGIRQQKKSSVKGRGVLGALLGSDGSVTHEQSRML